MQKLRIIFLSCFIVSGLACVHAYAQEEIQATYRGTILSIIEEHTEVVPNTTSVALYQTFSLRITTGPFKDRVVTITDSAFKVSQGDDIYVTYWKTQTGEEFFNMMEPYRIPQLLMLFGAFIVAVLLFGGMHGFLSLVSLFISFGVVFKLLFPQLLTSDNIVLIATAIALLSLFVVMYVTHGFTRLTTSAFLGSTFAVIMTVALAKFSVAFTSLTGFSSEESVYLNIATNGSLDFLALLVGGIIIGVIGVVDDVTVTQASVVNELRKANPNLSRADLYLKALKVGKDHMGAVVNTLILAYTGASLPLVLLLYTSTAPMIELINREAIATEIVRSIVGSIGLLFAMPLTTMIAVWLMYKNPDQYAHAHGH